MMSLSSFRIIRMIILDCFRGRLITCSFSVAFIGQIGEGHHDRGWHLQTTYGRSRLGGRSGWSIQDTNDALDMIGSFVDSWVSLDAS